MMPAYSSKSSYELTAIQVDLIIYALQNLETCSITEDDEKRKVIEALNSYDYIPGPFTELPPYDNLCDI